MDSPTPANLRPHPPTSSPTESPTSMLTMTLYILLSLNPYNWDGQVSLLTTYNLFLPSPIPLIFLHLSVLHLIVYLERFDILFLLNSIASKDDHLIPDTSHSTVSSPRTAVSVSHSAEVSDIRQAAIHSIFLSVGRPTYSGLTPLHLAALKGQCRLLNFWALL